jgi:plasmid stabilization system protein ParE
MITLKKIISQTDVLNKEPRIGRVVPELGVDSIRELIYANYRIVYQVGNEEIVTLTVHHSAMLFGTSKFA